MAVLLVFMSVCFAWWATWRTTNKIAKQNKWSTFMHYSNCILLSLLAAFSIFCIFAGLLLPDPENTGRIVITLGAFILFFLIIYLWRASNSVQQRRFNVLHAASVAQIKCMPRNNECSSTEIADISLPHVFSFKYIDHQGQASSRRVRVMAISSKDGRNYLEGFCFKRHAMRSFRVDRIQGELVDDETGELINIYSLLAAVLNLS